MNEAHLDPALRSSPDGDAPPGAPRTPVPSHGIVCIEHPCIIKNIDKGLTSLGGPHNIERFLRVDSNRALTRHDGSTFQKSASKTIAASLRPDDPWAKPIMSRQADTNNILLKITVPKRTGRKRKRGTNGPYLTEQELAGEAAATKQQDSKTPATVSAHPRQLLRILRDNPSAYTFQALGIINEAHRFRNLPDMQYASSTDPFMVHFRDTILSRNYPKVKDFKLDIRSNLPENVGPPPVFCQVDMPFNYGYQQNALVKFTKDSAGKIIAVNTNKPFQIIMHHVAVDAPNIPKHAHKDTIPESRLKKSHRVMISRLRKLMESRPILTRRYMLNMIEVTSQDDLRQSLQYCGYHFVTGPWKECLIKFGLDPRKDPENRIYQTVSFQVQFQARYQERSEWVDQRTVQHSYMSQTEKDKTSHVFNGTTVIPDGKVWQVCDITDPQLRRVLDTPDLRPRCDVRIDGWFRNGTTAKLRGIMKSKLERIRKGEFPDPKLYERSLAFPDEYLRTGVDRTIYDGGLAYTAEESHLLATIKTMARESYKGTRRRHGMDQRGLDDVQQRGVAEEEEDDEDDEDDDIGDLEEDEDQDEIEEEARREVEREMREEEEMETDDSFFEDEEEDEEAGGDDADDDGE